MDMSESASHGLSLGINNAVCGVQCALSTQHTLEHGNAHVVRDFLDSFKNFKQGNIIFNLLKMDDTGRCLFHPDLPSTI